MTKYFFSVLMVIGLSGIANADHHEGAADETPAAEETMGQKAPAKEPMKGKKVARTAHKKPHPKAAAKKPAPKKPAPKKVEPTAEEADMSMEGGEE